MRKMKEVGVTQGVQFFLNSVNWTKILLGLVIRPDIQ